MSRDHAFLRHSRTRCATAGYAGIQIIRDAFVMHKNPTCDAGFFANTLNVLSQKNQSDQINLVPSNFHTQTLINPNEILRPERKCSQFTLEIYLQFTELLLSKYPFGFQDKKEI